MIEIDVGIVGPKSPVEFVAGNQTARAFQQCSENFEWLLLKPDVIAISAQLGCFEVNLELGESEERAGNR